MSQKGLRRWAWLGALVSAMVLGSACGKRETVDEQSSRTVPREGTRYEGLVNTGQSVESFGQEPRQQGTGGGGQQGQQQSQVNQQLTPEQAQKLGPEQASGAQGKEGGIGAPGYSTPQETGTPGTGVTGQESQQQRGVPTGSTRTETGGIRQPSSTESGRKGNPPSQSGSSSDKSDLGPGTPLGH